ncbi:MAG TPA: hypothetical protein VH720_09980, partial [Candidatus Limnocylindrales bacterium]
MTAFDPTATLPGPPEPWTETDTPTPRDGPPYHMTDMIAAEPFIARRVLGRLARADSAAVRLAAAVRDAARGGRPIVVTGCGTSEHGALGTVDILAEALTIAGIPAMGLTAAQAFELALDPPASGLVIGISHEGATQATNDALRASRDAGASVALVTVSARSPGAALVDPDLVVETGELDTSWCHTVGYLSPLLVAAAVGGHLTGRVPDPDAVGDLFASSAGDSAAAERIAGELAQISGLIVIGSGADRTAGRELTLKVEEASWLPTAYRDLETLLHGHLPATGERTGLIVVATDRRARSQRMARARNALAAARVVGTRVAAIVSAEADRLLPADAAPAGRLVIPEADALPAPVASLIGSAAALQLLTERIARARGTNPDPIRRDDPRYRAAAEAASGD